MTTDAQDERWRGGVDAKLDVVITQLANLNLTKEADHEKIHRRQDATDKRVDLLESKWDRLFGAAIGIGIGAGAIGGGIGAVVSKVIGG